PRRWPSEGGALMPVYIFEPHDPLIARDGRPFTATPGARAASLPFPPPSTTTGTIRTLAGRREDGRFDPETMPALRRGPLRGPRRSRGEKPAGDAPRFWYWETLLDWLGAATHEDQVREARALGHDGPQGETRVHVGIAPDRQSAVEGALFETRGLEFARRPDG